MKKQLHLESDIEQYYINAKRQLDNKKRSIDRFSKRDETILDYIKRHGFNPNTSTGKRVMRAIEQGHADWDLNTIRGHGRPWSVKGLFDEEGKLPDMQLKNRREASKWGDYYNALHKFRRGDVNALKPFEGKYYVDANGNKHIFVTSFDTLYTLDKAGEIPSGDEISLSSRP